MREKFPYKVELINPNRRIDFGEIESRYPDVFEWFKTKTVHRTQCVNPMIRIYVHELVSNWCNLQFSTMGWDVEYRNNSNHEFDSMSLDQWFFCFRSKENVTFFNLTWN